MPSGCCCDSILESVHRRPCLPRRKLLEDQIIWGRCPVRLDLAGGWTDTPPYCLTHGGRVVNVAVNLNGQPPIQVFAKLSSEPQIVLRSIDLGVEGRVTTFDELRRCGEPLGPFSIAKAALSLAGFLPEFSAGPAAGSLRQQLEEFGGGLEISLLAAVPKGSGLGTSSILAATLLGSLGELCGLGWGHAENLSPRAGIGADVNYRWRLARPGGRRRPRAEVHRHAAGPPARPARPLAAGGPVYRPRAEELHAPLLHGDHAHGQEHPQGDRAGRALERQPPPRPAGRARRARRRHL